VGEVVDHEVVLRARRFEDAPERPVRGGDVEPVVAER